MKQINSRHTNSQVMSQIIDRFIELFEAQIRALPEMEELLNSTSSVAEHNRLMRIHLEKTYSEISTIDAFQLSHRVGQSHIDNKVRLSWYLDTYIKLFEAYHAAHLNDGQELPNLDDFRAIWLRDAGSSLDSYYEHLIAQHERENRELQDSINELDLQAKTDPLTEILNRRGFRSEIDRTSAPGLFILLDLDNFKSVNDHQGHIVGDNILKKVAAGLMSQLRKGDLAGRIGGDEFAVWLPAPPEIGTDDIKAIVNRILGDIPFNEWNIGISGGIAIRPEHAYNFDDLYAKADTSLYQAKLIGDFTLIRYGNPEVIDINPHH